MKGPCIEVASLEELLASGKRFRTIYADPPWPYRNRWTRSSAQKNYVTESMDWIKALPIDKLAEKSAHLHLWTTVGFRELAHDLIRAWGFQYRSELVWGKTPGLGIGNYWRLVTEHLLLGVRGDYDFRDHTISNLIITRRGAHSRKPDQVRALIERVSAPDRLELFAREHAPGWWVWGNEIARNLFSQPINS